MDCSDLYISSNANDVTHTNMSRREQVLGEFKKIFDAVVASIPLSESIMLDSNGLVPWREMMICMFLSFSCRVIDVLLLRIRTEAAASTKKKSGTS